jgi:hypothetical protein
MNRILYIVLACFLINCKPTINKEKLNTSFDKNDINTVFPKKNISHYLPKNFGHSFSPSYQIKIGIYIPSIQENKGFIKGITIKVKKSSIYDIKKSKVYKCKKDQYAPFLINVYDFDLKTKLTTKKYLLNDSLICMKKNDKEIFFDLDKYNIPFSENGIFITLEKLTIEEYKKLGFINGPSFGIVGVSNDNNIIPYSLNQRYKNEWKVDNHLLNRKNTYDITLMVKKINQKNK